MKSFVETLIALIPFLQAYPAWVHWVVVVWVLFSATLVAVLLLAYHPAPAPSAQQLSAPRQVTQSTTVTESPGSTVYQAGRDIVVTAPSKPKVREARPKISSVMVEIRLTCELKANAELPPGEADFLPIGDAHAYLEGAAGKIRLAFQSPVRFRRLDGDRVVVINRFTLEVGSDLLGRPLEALRNYTTLSVPVVTVVWGKSLQAFRVLEVLLSVNNEDPLYGSYSYDVPFQQGPRFTVPLGPFHSKLFREG